MNESYIQKLFASRIGGENFGKDTAIYKFEKIKRAKREAKKNHPDTELIDMGVGEPDMPAFKGVVDVLAEEAPKKENRFYSDNGIAELKDAVSKYMDKVYGVKGIDSEKEVNHSIGSKPALAMLPLTLINHGDATITTSPGYPVLGTHTKYLGGEVYSIKLTKENDFLPDLKSIPADIAKRAKILLLNYPNNPTGKNATVEFYKEAIDFARKNNIVLVQDAAYAALVYGGKKPLSILSIDGAKEVAIEVHSFSKAFNMTGWRLAFIVGNSLMVNAFATVKDNCDSGQFIAIQKAGIHALNHPEYTEQTRDKYERRLKKMVEILKKNGFDASMPDGSFYLYVASPKGTKSGMKFENAEEFSQFMIKELLISTVPWDDAGHFVRFCAAFEAKDENDETRVLLEIDRRISSCEFVF